MERLGLDIKILFAQIVNFVILFFILKKILYKPLIKLIDERNKKINEAIENSAKIEDKLESLDKKSKQILAKARILAEEERKEILAIANKEKEKIIEEARLQAKKEVSKGLERLQEERMVAIQEASEDFMEEVVKRLYAKLSSTTKDRNFPLLKEVIRR